MKSISDCKSDWNALSGVIGMRLNSVGGLARFQRKLTIFVIFMRDQRRNWVIGNLITELTQIECCEVEKLNFFILLYNITYSCLVVS
jgi:hypothetical protein